MYTLIVTIQGGVIRIKTKGIRKTGLLDDRIIIFSFLCNVVDVDFTFLNEKNIYIYGKHIRLPGSTGLLLQHVTCRKPFFCPDGEG